eukprot:tig00000334_g24108.t1
MAEGSGSAAKQDAAAWRAQLFREIAASTIAGTIHAAIEQPLVIPIEAAITQTQVNGKRFSQNFKELWRQRALYRSLPVAMVGAVPKRTLHYGILVFVTDLFVPDADGDVRKANPAQAALVGTLTGAMEVCVTNPINMVKFRLQRPEWGYTGASDAIRKIYHTEGLSAFWKGSMWTVARNSIFNGVMMATFQLLFDGRGGGTQHVARNTLAGSFGGVMGSIVSYPFEMARSAKQHNVSFKEEIWAQGPRRIFSGWVPGACRLVVTSSIMGFLLPQLNAFSRALVFGDQPPAPSSPSARPSASPAAPAAPAAPASTSPAVPAAAAAAAAATAATAPATSGGGSSGPASGKR